MRVQGTVRKGQSMRIAQSSITMTSGRDYCQSGIKARGAINKNSFESMKGAISSGEYSGSGVDNYTRGNSGMYGQDLYAINYGKIFGSSFTGSLGTNGFQTSLLSSIMGRLGGAGLFGGMTQQFVTYQEYEETSFHADGQARTEDGRIIDFNVDITMSRSYMEYMNIQIPMFQDALCDPLIVNIGSDTANVRDQKFMFDIDADGKEDEISMLGKGSGFLALDKNEDGTINDGSELFGTKSGDGFGDLREYDSDGNGWIDENDEIFSKLKVWCKGDNGEDILMDLKAADIGAIYLGAQDTEFTMSGEDGARDGVIRSTGVFLRESAGGGAGTVQHVDMSVGSAGDKNINENQGEVVITSQNISSGNRSSQEARSKRERNKAIEKKREAERLIRKKIEKRRLDRLSEHKRYLDKIYEKEMAREDSVTEAGEDALDSLFEDRGNIGEVV